MAIAIVALVTWLITAIGGFVMLGQWIAKGGLSKDRPASTKLPPAVIFSHFGLAALGLVLWIIYVFTDNHGIAWTAFVLLIPVAALGIFMFLRWLPTYRAGEGGGSTAAGTEVAERHFPLAVVGGHGVFAVATVVLAFLAALGL